MPSPPAVDGSKGNISTEAAGSQVVVLHPRPRLVVRARRTKSPGSPQGTSEGTGMAPSCHSQFSVQKLLVTRGLADSRLYSFGPRSRDRPGGAVANNNPVGIPRSSRFRFRSIQPWLSIAPPPSAATRQPIEGWKDTASPYPYELHHTPILHE